MTKRFSNSNLTEHISINIDHSFLRDSSQSVNAPTSQNKNREAEEPTSLRHTYISIIDLTPSRFQRLHAYWKRGSNPGQSTDICRRISVRCGPV